MFLLGNKRWLCACVFFVLVFFFKEIGRRKLLLPFLTPPFPCFLPPPPPFFRQTPSTFPPRPFCSFFPFSVLFCYESTFLFVIFGSPGFLFSVKSPYASSALRLLLPPPGPDWLCWAGPAPLPPRSFPPPAGLGGGGWRRGGARTSGAGRAPSRRAWAPGRLLSELGGGVAGDSSDWNQRA